MRLVSYRPQPGEAWRAGIEEQGLVIAGSAVYASAGRHSEKLPPSANCLRQVRRPWKPSLLMPDRYLALASRNWCRLTRLNWGRRYPTPIKLSVWGSTMPIMPPRQRWLSPKFQYFLLNFATL